MALGALVFSTPWLLLSLIGLPILWVLLRAMPPAPVRRYFPGVILLLGLKDENAVLDKTPWWLLLMRMLLLACVVIALSGPAIVPDASEESDAPLLVLMDGGWASGPTWQSDSDTVETMLRKAERSGRRAALIRLSTPVAPDFLPPGAVLSRLPDFAPLHWGPTAAQVDDFIAASGDQSFDTLWLSDGLAYEGRARLLSHLQARGTVQLLQSVDPVVAINDVALLDGVITLSIVRSQSQNAQAVQAVAIGRDPNGAEQVLARATVNFAPEDRQAQARFTIPIEMRNRISRFELAAIASAGAVHLVDNALLRRKVALVSVREDREGLELLSQAHFLRHALSETTELIEADLALAIQSSPDVVLLPDIVSLAPTEVSALVGWIEKGGVLLRFAGPQMAASELSRSEEHILMPVRLRTGGRSIGGTMTWGSPKSLAPFAQSSPFFGLPIPEDLRIRAQVVAQPDPTLAQRVLAELSDGTPLVTRKFLGQGQVVLVHVPANAEWSGLALSGLFLQMLDRLVAGSGSEDQAAVELGDGIWQPMQVLDGFGRLQSGQDLSGVPAETLSTGAFDARFFPGLYQSEARLYARNVLRSDQDLESFDWPADVTRIGAEEQRFQDLTAPFLIAALLFLLVDIVLSLMVSGRLALPARSSALVIGMVGLGFSAPEAQAQAQAGPESPQITLALGYVVTGDAAVDETSYAGLYGLSSVLFRRTSIEPVAPVAVDIETSELAFFPFLYWPITPQQANPSPEAYAKLNQYLRTGGMILFDTRDGDVAQFGRGGPEGRKLQEIGQALDIPKLEIMPRDHVLTRTFYLLQDAPGRFNSPDIWVEAAPADAAQELGMPFRNLNDGVTPVLIGGNDWASAWAIDENGAYLKSVGRGRQGALQREIAYRFGVNLIMHVLTGNYKSDQVHVPALLQRLGQ